jgi:hypothetical protein
MIILKRVKSLKQLRNTEKELVRLCYKEAILKGFVMVNDIQCYIGSRSKIWVERTGIEYLKKSEEEENKKWYFNLAKDHFAYIGVYRKTYDELEQCKKELWSMLDDHETTNSEKVQILKELHNLSKTSILLLRDLPFISNLTKYYDLKFFDMDNNMKESGQDSFNENNNNNNKEIIERKVSERFRKMVNDSALFTLEQKRKMGIVESTNNDEKVIDPVMDGMRKQLTMTPEDILESINNKDYQESIRKLKEIREG